MFKELLLRHSVQRPPHSLAIFNLDDVKAINDFVQDSYFRYYNMYLYTLTPKDMMVLGTEAQFELEEHELHRLDQGKHIPPCEIEDLKRFMSQNELDQIEKENEYMLRGPGRIERIMQTEMEKLTTHMEERIKKQDEDFLNKISTRK